MAKVDVRDAVLLLGLVSMLYGIAQWSVPAAWVCGGAGLVAVWLRPHLGR